MSSGVESCFHMLCILRSSLCFLYIEREHVHCIFEREQSPFILSLLITVPCVLAAATAPSILNYYWPLTRFSKI
jgi:hypothetical protein